MLFTILICIGQSFFFILHHYHIIHPAHNTSQSYYPHSRQSTASKESRLVSQPHVIQIIQALRRAFKILITHPQLMHYESNQLYELRGQSSNRHAEISYFHIKVEGFRCDNKNWLGHVTLETRRQFIIIVLTQTYFIIKFCKHEIVLT